MIEFEEVRDFIVWDVFHPVKSRLSDLKYWFFYRFHPKHRYNLIKLGPPRYYEYDEQMEKAILITFINYWEEDRERHYFYQDILDPFSELPDVMENVGYNWTEEESLNYIRKKQQTYLQMEARYNWAKWWLETDPPDKIIFTGDPEHDKISYEFQEGLLEDRTLHLIDIIRDLDYYWV